MKKLFLCLFALLPFLFTSCSQAPDERKPIVLSADLWIGHAPIFYAHAVGWLKEANIELLHTPSIGESVTQFESGAADLITTTGYEFLHLKQKYPDFTACIIHDKSFGGDVIVSNRSLEALHKSDEVIELYLEPKTLNEEMWHYLMEFEEFPKERFRVAPKSQEEMSRLKTSASEPPVMAITFNPYDLPMMKNGFVQIASTKDSRYLIVDGIHAKRAFIHEHKAEILQLKEAMEKAVNAYHKDPKGFYEKVKPYLNHPEYDEFQAMVHNIEWIFPYPSEEMLIQLSHIGYDTKDLVR